MGERCYPIHKFIGDHRAPYRGDPKPCPTCYTPMRWIGGDWRCEKHGQTAKA